MGPKPLPSPTLPPLPHARTSGVQLLAQCELDICEVVHKPKVQALLVEALCLIKGVWAFCELACLLAWVFVSFS